MSKLELQYKIQDLIRRAFCRYINHNFIFEIDPVVEKIVLNRGETDGYFPEKDYEIVAWSNDFDNPYRFHIISKGFDVTINANDGKIIRINLVGKNNEILNYIRNNAKNWLIQKGVNNIKTEISYIKD